MHKDLEIYLDEISHFLPDPAEREEILNEIRSHIMEKAEQEGGSDPEVALQKVIAAYGKPRQVAEKYLESRPIIAPAYQRFLFRYTALLFAAHLSFTVFAVLFNESFVVFPFLFMPRLGIFEAIQYLPMAFLADFGLVALVLYFITRSGKEIRLPWPKLSLDLGEVKAVHVKSLAARIWTWIGAGILLSLTGAAVGLYMKYSTVFVASVNFKDFRPLLLPNPGRPLSLIVIALLAIATVTLIAKSLSRSWRRAYWADAVSNVLGLVLIAVALRLLHASMFTALVPAKLHAWLSRSLTWTLLVMALIMAIDLIIDLVRLGRGRLKK